MIYEDRFCEYCPRRIAKRKRADARFCSNRCKLASQRQRARQAEGGEKSASLAPRTSLTHKAAGANDCKDLERLLVRHAPPGAVGYRLGNYFRLEGQEIVRWVYPPHDRPYRRHDGTLARRPYFLLQPFEPPLVPISDSYDVEFVRRDGATSPLELEDDQGIEVKAGPYAVQVEDGEQQEG